MTPDEFAQLQKESERLLDEAVKQASANGVGGLFPGGPTLRESGWKVDFHGRVSAGGLGLCSFGRDRRTGRMRRDIAVTILPVTPLAQGLDTLRHEFAHAVCFESTGLSGPADHHGPRWQSCAKALGADPSPTAVFSPEEIAFRASKAKWILRHKETGEVINSYHRKPTFDGSSHYIRNRMNETMGKLEVVPQGTPLAKDLAAAKEASAPVPAPAPTPPGPLPAPEVPVPANARLRQSSFFDEDGALASLQPRSEGLTLPELVRER